LIYEQPWCAKKADSRNWIQINTPQEEFWTQIDIMIYSPIWNFEEFPFIYDAKAALDGAKVELMYTMDGSETDDIVCSTYEAEDIGGNIISSCKFEEEIRAKGVRLRLAGNDIMKCIKFEAYFRAS
jgi:hypothetical protein